MANDLKQREGAEAPRIDVRDAGQLREWAHKLDATSQQIEDAVRAVGDRADEVEVYLKGTRSSVNGERLHRSAGPGG